MSLDDLEPRSFAPPQDEEARRRRRHALLRLADRHGEVRVAVRVGEQVVPHAEDVLELLDELNAAGRLSWGGMQADAQAESLVYRKI